MAISGKFVWPECSSSEDNSAGRPEGITGHASRRITLSPADRSVIDNEQPENEKTSIVNGGVDVATLKKDQQPAPREIFAGEDLLEDKLDARNHRRQDLNGMPELNGDEAELRDEEVTLDLGEPSPEVMDYARRELGESDEVKCQTIQELRDMIYERGECLPHRMDDDFLVRFLRVRNFNVNRAHRLIVNYYNFKEEHPEIHQDVNPLEMKHIGEDDVMTVPSYRTNCGRRMMIYRLGNWDPRKYPVEEIFKATVIILELGVLEPRAQILGGVAIFDLQGITMSHAWTITPQVANMVIALMVTAFPMKTTAIHILHQSWVFDVMFAVFKPLLDVRMQNKIFFHGSNMDSLHQHIAPSHLPKKYGGTREELPYYRWMDNLSKDLRIVKEMMQVGYVIHPDLMKQMGLPIEK